MIIVTGHIMTTHFAKEPPEQKILSYIALGGKWKQYLKYFSGVYEFFCVDLKNCRI